MTRASLLYNRTFSSRIGQAPLEAIAGTQMSENPATTPATRSCHHVPTCPPANAIDRDAAHVLAAHPEQGWSLLCNGVGVFEDFGEILPDGHCTGSRDRELAMASRTAAPAALSLAPGAPRRGRPG